MTRSEELVFSLCTKSFFSLWSYARPRGKKGKELCDILVVCDPDLLIFSVKEVQAREGAESETEWERWRREAVDASVRQLYGAARWLSTASDVIQDDGRPGLPLPDQPSRRVHRIAVALGSGGQFPLGGGDHGKGFVHVFDERALDVLMRELDAITDFTDYLRAKEHLLGRTRVFAEGEESLLAVYLRGNRHFPESLDSIHIDGDHWLDFEASAAYQAKQQADVDSRAFDEIIVRFAEPALAGTLERGATLSDTERIVRVMARETRFHRRVLGKCFMDFMRAAARSAPGLARITISGSGVVYVFLAVPRSAPRDLRSQDLQQRCLVARGLHRANRTVIGVATEQLDGVVGVSLDGCCIDLSDWDDEHEREFQEIQRVFNYFANLSWTHGQEDEYPGA